MFSRNPQQIISLDDLLVQQTIIETGYEPPPGTIVYCELGPAEHSGVYIGKGTIVQLNRHGTIEAVSPETFTDSLATLNRTIMVPFDGNNDYDDEPWKNCNTASLCGIADTARTVVGKRREYNVILDNCHQFSAGCITGDFSNATNFLWMLKSLVQEEVNFGDPVLWFAWDWQTRKLTRKKYPDLKEKPRKWFDPKMY